jgi:hypothetical protein
MMSVATDHYRWLSFYPKWAMRRNAFRHGQATSALCSSRPIYCLTSVEARLPIPDPYADEILERLRNKLTARFVTICCGLTPKDFHILMDDMAREQIRGENARRWH